MVSLMARSYFFSSGRLAAAMDWPTRRNFSSGSSALRDLAVSGYSSSSTFWAVVRMRSPPFQCPLAACGPCGGTCRLKSQLAAEFNALSIRDMPEVTDLNPLPGSFINLPYTLPNGQMVKLLEDDKIYLGNQLESLSGSPRCYGLAADEACLLVCAYGQGGSDPEIIAYQKRRCGKDQS